VKGAKQKAGRSFFPGLGRKKREGFKKENGFLEGFWGGWL